MDNVHKFTTQRFIVTLHCPQVTSDVRTLQDPNVTLSQLIPTLVTLTLATEKNTNKTKNLSPKNPLLVDFQKLL